MEEIFVNIGELYFLRTEREGKQRRESELEINNNRHYLERHKDRKRIEYIVRKWVSFKS